MEEVFVDLFMRWKCPYCKETFDETIDLLEEEINCPGCGASYILTTYFWEDGGVI